MNKMWPLESPVSAPFRKVELVRGPKPYLWIGDDKGEFFGATLDTDQLRDLRDEITKALRHAE